MASINGISIKSLKSFLDHEGMEIYQGNVYYKGKKLGFWSQDSWGGPDQFGFDEGILDAEVEKFRNSELVEERYRQIVNVEIVLNELVEICQFEKKYKKNAKSGFKTLVWAHDGYGYSSKRSKDKELACDYYRKFAQEHSGAYHTYVFGSLEDFEITV